MKLPECLAREGTHRYRIITGRYATRVTIVDCIESGSRQDYPHTRDIIATAASTEDTMDVLGNLKGMMMTVFFLFFFFVELCISEPDHFWRLRCVEQGLKLGASWAHGE